MKTWIIIFSILITNIAISQTIGPTIYESEANPNGIVFPRMTTVERNNLQAVEGQCIYNTITQEINCFNGIDWVNASDLNQLIDNDLDTKVTVEKIQDEDIIRFDLKGTEVLSLQNNFNKVFRIDYKSQSSNLIIGDNAGFNLNYSGGLNGTSNTLIGVYAGSGMTSGYWNTLIGDSSGINLNGHGNTFLGNFTGNSISNNGNYNTFLGMWTGATNRVGSSNTFVGYSAGIGNETGSENVFIGRNSSSLASSGVQSVAIGAGSSSNVANGNYQSVVIGYDAGKNGQINARNVIIGSKAGYSSSTTSYIEGNVILGNEAGYSLEGSNNIFIGNKAGFNESGNNKLYIETSSSSNPLIYGEFDNNLVRVNGTLHITETAKLTPLSTVPTCTSAEEGLLYFDANTRTLQVCKGSLGWREILTN